ncbi:MAG: amino acid dehydrogenase [Candidatus Magasanikbacteria bacterium CG_4_10_14_0_2_um_filter_37_12]|uniref:Amino acid dehydrogenase n=1 Tax=Candidatus Magasanikbacteria bacterium CG_4_10_14_0_2_um_filter_37_12 TaxID=1974637 RepID=A0A2M7VAK0_9BACT|nr:MAG: amino acid dehydrogenase [Candidatus Magasanikbacteria bacterium CG_4_10_14_0_2_um_filter_37_12]
MFLELEKFFKKKPKKIIHWKDSHSVAEGWLVINSLYNGAAGGGTRMSSSCNRAEVEQLAKTMEIKFTVSGPEIGGAKSGIRYDFKNEDEKRDVLSRWFAFIKKELSTCYGTGGDQNVDFKNDVSVLLSKIGINHPQEGIVNGLYTDLDDNQRLKIINNLKLGVLTPVTSNKFLQNLGLVLSDVATGYGVASSLQAFYDLTDRQLIGQRVVLEGFGNVGSASAYFAKEKGAKIIGILDKDWYIFDDHGIDINLLLQARNRGVLNVFSNLVTPYRDELKEILSADIFIPAATSHTVGTRHMQFIKSAGVSVIAPGANNPFFDGEIEKEADINFSVIPEFIVNCGMARCFNYLMKLGCLLSETAILDDIEKCIRKSVDEILHNHTNLQDLTKAGYEVALRKINSR